MITPNIKHSGESVSIRLENLRRCFPIKRDEYPVGLSSQWQYEFDVQRSVARRAGMPEFVFGGVRLGTH